MYISCHCCLYLLVCVTFNFTFKRFDVYTYKSYLLSPSSSIFQLVGEDEIWIYDVIRTIIMVMYHYTDVRTMYHTTSIMVCKSTIFFTSVTKTFLVLWNECNIYVEVDSWCEREAYIKFYIPLVCSWSFFLILSTLSSYIIINYFKLLYLRLPKLSPWTLSEAVPYFFSKVPQFWQTHVIILELVSNIPDLNL